MTPEEWRPVVGYEGRYEVSSLGRVRSLTRTVPAGPPPGQRVIRGQDMKLPVSASGYLQVTLAKRTFTVHTLVAKAFLGPRPEGLEVRHLNGAMRDNRLTNLAYGTVSENRHDTVRHGRHRQANRTHCPKGHPYDAENTGPSTHGRRCRACHREDERARRIARNAALPKSA